MEDSERISSSENYDGDSSVSSLFSSSWNTSSNSSYSSSNLTDVNAKTHRATKNLASCEENNDLIFGPSTSKRSIYNFAEQNVNIAEQTLTDPKDKSSVERPAFNIRDQGKSPHDELRNSLFNKNYRKEFSFRNCFSEGTKQKCEEVSKLALKSNCSFCNESFPNQISLDNHHCAKPPVFCDVCGDMFEKIEDVKIHKVSHIICDAFPCDICDKYEEQDTVKKSHDLDRYRCATCGKTYNHFRHFSQHLKIHLQATPFCCETCGKTFTLLNSYNQHLASHKKLYHCKICNAAFKTKLLCHQHNLKHMKKVMHCCEICGKEFRTPSLLKSHSRSHEVDKNYECVECGTSYSYKASLLRHNTKYHSSNSEIFPCTQCKETFKNRQLLRCHIALHSATKVKKCTECSRSFISASSLKRHLLKHKGIRPFPCTDCEKAFLTKKELRSHNSVIHFKDDT